MSRIDVVTASEKSVRNGISTRQAVLLCLGAGGAFQLAAFFPRLGFLIAVSYWCLFELTRLKSDRQTSYYGLAAGLLIYAPQADFLWRIFGPACIALWLVLAFWLRIFLVLARGSRERFGPAVAALLIPFLWTGLEFFRSELYYLRFSWFSAGYVLSAQSGWIPYHWLGGYGIGFVLMAGISAFSSLPIRKRRFAYALGLLLLATAINLPRPQPTAPASSAKTLAVAGIQLEFPVEFDLPSHLDRLLRQYPEAQLLALSEYTVDGPVPPRVLAWCRQNHRYLVIGAKDPAPNSNYYDTAFVVGPDGNIVFRQGKSVPIQFFKDGLPAPGQKLWDSPWGKLGFCVCYDLSYRKVTDELIRQGAEAIIVPTMDVEDWGRHQHELHARVAPARAAEYHLPIFRIASSGISQIVDATGCVTASAPMPGQGDMISGTLELAGPGSLPLDTYLAPLAAWISGVFGAWLAAAAFRNWLCTRRKRPI